MVSISGLTPVLTLLSQERLFEDSWLSVDRSRGLKLQLITIDRGGAGLGDWATTRRSASDKLEAQPASGNIQVGSWKYVRRS